MTKNEFDNLKIGNVLRQTNEQNQGREHFLFVIGIRKNKNGNMLIDVFDSRWPGRKGSFVFEHLETNTTVEI
jgi:hypothetical protein